jgi:FkbM family methyltransferase
LAIARQNFRCGVILDYDDADIYESRVEDLGHINPSVEFWLFNNAPDIDNALVVGAGFGLSSKQLVQAGATVTSVEPQSDRFALLESNVPTSTNINKMCCESAGTANLLYFEDNKSAAVINRTMGDATESVECIIVDSLDLTLDLMLIQANGKELDVIDGASTTIADNADMKIILRWIPDLLDDVDAAITKLNGYGKTIKIIHWEKDGDAISYKDVDDDILKAVGSADLLLE